MEIYGYEDLLLDIEELQAMGVKTGILGESEQQRPIPYVSIGKGSKSIFCIYATHAREHITSALAMRHIRHYLDHPVKGFELIFVPMHNPDGVELCKYGADSVFDSYKRDYLVRINRGKDFTLWKANANAVDLNVNFPAGWGLGLQNVFSPAPENYIGEFPLSESENRAVTDFALRKKLSGVLCFHSKGEEIYWRFGQKGERLKRDKAIARTLAQQSGYLMVDGKGSYGGCKDWFIEKFSIPSFTVEVGSDKREHPVPYEDLDGIESKTKLFPKLLCENITAYSEKK